MKTILHAFKFIAIFLTAIFLYACPVFKSIKYPKTVFLGDTATIHVNIDLMGMTDYEAARLEIILPEGWQLTDTAIVLDGLSNSIDSLEHHPGDADGYWSVWVSDQVVSDNILFDLQLVNTKSTPSADTFRISFGDEVMLYGDKEIVITSINDENVPTQFIYHDDTLEWTIPKNSSDTKGYFVTDNLSSWFTTDNKVYVNAGTDLHRYSVMAVTNDDVEYALNDTIFIFHGDSLFVSGSGDNQNLGTETSPLKSLKLALNVIDEDYFLSKDKSIRLLEGNYFLDTEVELRDRVSLIGNGPQNTKIFCTDTATGIVSEDLNTGFSIANLSIHAEQNNIILDFSSRPLDDVEISLYNVQLYNEGNARVGLRNNAQSLTLDHFLVTGMDSAGVESTPSQIINSNFVDNEIGLIPTFSIVNFGITRIVNSIFYNNQTSILSDSPSEEQDYITLYNTIIEQKWVNNGTGNFYADPLFIEDENYPYLLDPSSPAVDAAIDSAKYCDPSSDEDDYLAKFPARGTIVGDLGIYGGGGNDLRVGIVSHRIYHDLDFYPNPVKDILTIHWPNNKTPDEMWLSNVNGMRLKLFCQHNQIDLSKYPPGLYLLFAEIDGKYYRSKIIKN